MNFANFDLREIFSPIRKNYLDYLIIYILYILLLNILYLNFSEFILFIQEINNYKCNNKK